MSDGYGLDPVIAMPTVPRLEEELLAWASKIHTAILNRDIQTVDRLENYLLVVDTIVQLPVANGRRRIGFVRASKLMYIDIYDPVTQTASWILMGHRYNVSSFATVGGAGGGDFLLTQAHSALEVDATVAAANIYLPSAEGLTGQVFFICKTDSSANIVSVIADGTDTIVGNPSWDLMSQYDGMKLMGNYAGNGWLHES